MHKKFISIYVCDYCNKEFDRFWKCSEHERDKHKCPICEHAYYVYGCEFNCSRLNQNKNCRFKQNKI